MNKTARQGQTLKANEEGTVRRSGAQSHRHSIAWQKAMDLATTIYATTSAFPPEEKFGLTNQLRRASVSIASNIAEGQERLTSGEFAHFLGMARGSAVEVETQLELACRLAFGSPDTLQQSRTQAGELVKILNAILRTLRERNKLVRERST